MTTRLNILLEIIKGGNKARRTKDKKAKIKEPSAKATAIRDFVKKSDFGCRTNAVLGLMELVTGEKLVDSAKFDGRIKLQNGMVVMVVGDGDDSQSGHFFKDGSLAVYSANHEDPDNDDNTPCFMTVSHDESQYMYTGEYRRASKAEVATFVEQVRSANAAQQKNLLKFLL